MLQDIHFALRQLRRSPGLTLTAVPMAAFGIGVMAAIFSASIEPMRALRTE